VAFGEEEIQKSSAGKANLKADSNRALSSNVTSSSGSLTFNFQHLGQGTMRERICTAS
jgi:hypothetical protein